MNASELKESFASHLASAVLSKDPEAIASAKRAVRALSDHDFKLAMQAAAEIAYVYSTTGNQPAVGEQILALAAELASERTARGDRQRNDFED